jgi:carboxypeptidase Taq
MNNKISNYSKLESEIEKINQISNILSIAYWDAATYCPSGSAPSRQIELAALSSQIHKMLCSNEIGDLIKDSLNDLENLDSWQKANLKLIKKTYESAICIPHDLEYENNIASNECEFIWRKAKLENDFSAVEPYLDRVIDSTKKIASLYSDCFNKDPYDTLIDKYDPERTSKEIKSVFDILKKELPSLISKIIDKQAKCKIIPFSEKISEEKQKEIALRIVGIMGFDMTSGRLDKSVHPFCGGTLDDVRMTTRYDLSNFLSSLFGVIHETGHGLYQQNLPKNYKYQPVGHAKGLAFHESQSLFMEMQVCSSYEFIEFLAKLLRDEFSCKGQEYSADNLYNIINHINRGFIRVDADPATYPLHVIMRFEIEDEIINNNLKARDISKIWNDKMQNYLGITPEEDSKGCLQDIHWFKGSFGYFPAYTNGAIIASMLMSKAKNDYPDITRDLTAGKFSRINHFLNSNIRSIGSSMESSDLLARSTEKREIDPYIFLDFLKEKYL